jgi:hypothetical protein
MGRSRSQKDAEKMRDMIISENGDFEIRNIALPTLVSMQQWTPTL